MHFINLHARSKGCVAILRKSISNCRLPVINPPPRACERRGKREERDVAQFPGRRRNISIFIISIPRRPMASRSRSQIGIELGNFYSAKTNLRARGGRKRGEGWAWLHSVEEEGGGDGGEDIFLKVLVIAAVIPDKLDQFVRVTFALMYLRPRAFRLTASYTTAWNFRRRARGAAQAPSRSVGFRGSATSPRCRRIASHLPRIIDPWLVTPSPFVWRLLFTGERPISCPRHSFQSPGDETFCFRSIAQRFLERIREQPLLLITINCTFSNLNNFIEGSSATIGMLHI